MELCFFLLWEKYVLKRQQLGSNGEAHSKKSCRLCFPAVCGWDMPVVWIMSCFFVVSIFFSNRLFSFPCLSFPSCLSVCFGERVSGNFPHFSWRSTFFVAFAKSFCVMVHGKHTRASCKKKVSAWNEVHKNYKYPSVVSRIYRQSHKPQLQDKLHVVLPIKKTQCSKKVFTEVCELKKKKQKESVLPK